ncbi:MAG: S8 family serine peptidase [Synechococcus sp.]
MSAFLNDGQLVLAGFLDSRRADLSVDPSSAIGLVESNVRQTFNALSQLLTDRSAYTPNAQIAETLADSDSNRPLVPLRSAEFSPRNSVFSTSVSQVSTDALSGGMAVVEARTNGSSGEGSIESSSTPKSVDGKEASTSVKYSQPTQLLTQSIPNEIVVQAEDYRKGRNGDTYFDTTANNQGGEYRSDAVDIQKNSDVGGGYNVGWIRQGEWLTYDVSLQSGTYDVTIRASSLNGGGRLEMAAGRSTDTVRIGKTNSWQTFQDFTLEGFQVNGQQDTLRLNVLSGGFNLNYFKFVPSSSISSSPTPTSPTSSESSLRIEAEDYSSYYDTTDRNRGKAYRNDGVDIRAHSPSSGGFKVAETRPGEWLQYDVRPKIGTYDIVLRASTNSGGGQVDLSFGDNQIPFKLQSRKGLGRNHSFIAKGVKIGAGIDTLRLDIRSGLMHLDYIEFVPRPSTSGGYNPPSGEENNGDGDGGQGPSRGSGPGPLPQTPFNRTYGYGLVDASKAVSYALNSDLSKISDTRSGSNRASLNSMNVADVWNAGFTGQGQIIAVLDTGVDIQHRDLAKNIWTNVGEVAGDGIDNDGNGYVDDVNGYDFYNLDENPSDDNGHGTHLAGIIAGQRNNFGITGLAHKAKVMPVKILDSDGLGILDDIVKGIRYAVDNGADVVNLSLSVDFSQSSLRNAVKYAYDRGVVVVSAAGNYGDARPTFPARYAKQYGIAVGAVNSGNQFQWYSNKAGSNQLDYVVAPGHKITSAAPGGGMGSKSGTSQSTAQVAGVAALIRSANPYLSAKQVEDLIVKTANSTAVKV